MTETAKNEINIMELLIKISNDVSSIKTDMTNLKETQRKEKESTSKEIADVRTDYKRDLEIAENEIQTLRSACDSLSKRVEALEHADDKKDAKRWRAVMLYIGTACGGLLLGKLPDIIKLFTN